jgi:hypothetical protein
MRSQAVSALQSGPSRAYQAANKTGVARQAAARIAIPSVCRKALLMEQIP